MSTQPPTLAAVRRPGPPPRPAPRSTRALLMWSGGLDSTYSLLRLLQEGTDEVLVHHVHRHAGGAGRRCEAEARAVGRLLPSLRARCRGFQYSESRVDLSAFPDTPDDTALIMFFAARAAMSAGLTPFDRIVLGVNADEDPRWRADGERYQLRRLLALRMLRSVWEAEEIPHLYLWNPRPSKREILAALPPEIRAATVSCRDPLEGLAGDPEGAPRPCGRCRKCAHLRALEPGTGPAAEGEGAGSGERFTDARA